MSARASVFLGQLSRCSVSLLAILGVLSSWAHAQPPAESTDPPDTIFFGGVIDCCDPLGKQASAVAIRQGRIVAIGDSDSILALKKNTTECIDLAGAFVTPGLIDSHLHLVGLGESLQRVDLRTATTWEEVVELVAKQAKSQPAGTWIEGRGWHQAKWVQAPQPNIEGYPLHDLLSQKIPDHPVILTHASGHACLANAKAMELAKIAEETEDPDGGEIVRDANGLAIGLFRENAQSLVQKAQAKSEEGRSIVSRIKNAQRAIELGSRECLKYGITHVHDAGIPFVLADILGDMADEKQLPIRIYAMIREGSGELLRNMKSHRWQDRGDRLTVRSVKVSLDGALGPHGAWLLEPYEDLTTSRGLNTVALDELEKIAKLCMQEKWQLCVHAIGDRANREALNIFEKAIATDQRVDHRWRIEHAQHIAPSDLPRFAKSKVIPVMQAIHCTSDALFVIERLGVRRAAEGAYMWRQLIDQGNIVPNGTDAPVELVDPRTSLYASVTRQLPNGERFFPEQCMSRREALWSYTLWPAIASFQDNQLGSIEVGKWADLTVWDTNLLECPAEQLLTAKVQSTWVAGRQP